MTPRRFRIARTLRETKDIFTWELRAEDGGEFAFSPGQYNMVYIYGIGEVPVSISGDAADRRKLLHTTRAVGAVTEAMRALKKGDMAGVRGPFGSVWPLDKLEGKDIVLVAGGVGLPPLRPAVYHILRNRAKYGRCTLLCGARTPQDIAFAQELERWRGRLDFDVHVTVDSAGPDWRGNVGVVTTLVSRAVFTPEKTAALVCGPEIMMRFAAAELANRGVREDSMYITLERNMKCGIGLCGHCQLGPVFICKDGPVFNYGMIKQWFLKREI